MMKEETTAPPNPVMEFLQRCIYCGALPAQGFTVDIKGAAKAALDSRINWQELIEKAWYHKLIPLLYQRLKSEPGFPVPPLVMESLEALIGKISVNNLRQVQTLYRVLGLLDNRGIGVIVMKGPALAQSAYGDIAMRMFTDLDFLASADDFPEIHRILSQAGFRSNPDNNKKARDFRQQFRRDLEFTDGLNYLDFHPQVVPGPQTNDFSQTARQTYTHIECISGPIPVLSPGCTLLALCVDGTRNNWRYLRIFADIAHLVIRCGAAAFDWSAIFNTAGAAGCSRSLAAGLYSTRKLCGLQLAGEVETFISRQRHAVPLAEAFLVSLASGKAGSGKFNEVRALAKSLDSFPRRLKYLVHFIFIPSSRDLVKAPLPRWLFFLYYFIRPIRLLGNVIKVFSAGNRVRPVKRPGG